QYRAADPQGKIVEGTIEAAEVGGVVARLHDRGLVPIRIGAATEGTRAVAPRVALPSLPAFGRRRIKGRELLVMTQELAALVSAGLPLDRSLATLAELSDNLELRRIVTEVLHAVQGGKSLTEALAQHRVFPPLYVNMVRAAEPRPLGRHPELLVGRRPRHRCHRGTRALLDPHATRPVQLGPVAAPAPGGGPRAAQDGSREPRAYPRHAPQERRADDAGARHRQ